MEGVLPFADVVADACREGVSTRPDSPRSSRSCGSPSEKSKRDEIEREMMRSLAVQAGANSFTTEDLASLNGLLIKQWAADTSSDADVTRVPYCRENGDLLSISMLDILSRLMIERQLKPWYTLTKSDAIRYMEKQAQKSSQKRRKKRNSVITMQGESFAPASGVSPSGASSESETVASDRTRAIRIGSTDKAVSSSTSTSCLPFLKARKKKTNSEGAAAKALVCTRCDGIEQKMMELSTSLAHLKDLTESREAETNEKCDSLQAVMEKLIQGLEMEQRRQITQPQAEVQQYLSQLLRLEQSLLRLLEQMENVGSDETVVAGAPKSEAGESVSGADTLSVTSLASRVQLFTLSMIDNLESCDLPLV